MCSISADGVIGFLELVVLFIIILTGKVCK
jgi:hypothetical protein